MENQGEPTSPHRRRGLLVAPAPILGLMLWCGLSGGLYAYWHTQHYKHFAIHEPGRVYRSAWMESEAIGDIVQIHGIRTVVNLCRPGEMGPTRADEERRAVEAAGATLVELPFPHTTDARDERLQPIIALLENPASYPLLVHCQHGVNRTSRVLAMYEVLEHQSDGEQAILRMPKFGHRDYTPGEYEFARNFSAAFLDQTTASSVQASR